ncbi:hypothetical protein BSLG_006365 [Batrachochytrium salamandrivorans]|nr:hypothetical protein BASA81_009172 [Batrachochytrium salamandrivorans]KAJ1339227.1 hypothetical protein BSLG_006365 [Batrachochytrium salamandrivorans]
MFDPLLWVLHHFVTHYAGQTTQGDKNDGDYSNQASGSKDATSSLQGTTPTTLPTTLQESNILDQSGASSSTDLQPGKGRKGSVWKKSLFKSPPQQQSQPGSQPPTSYDALQSDGIPLPVYLEELKVKSHRRSQNHDQYNAFIADETEYFKSEYSFLRKIGKGDCGTVYLATRNSDGMEVAYKSITKSDVDKHASESSPPLICHLRNPLAFPEEASAAQCRSSRPPNLSVPYEFLLQMYLSQHRYENPYVPNTFDYIISKGRSILVMEYIGEGWMDLSKYVEEKGQLDIEGARDVVREVVEAMIYLKQYGILHRDIHGMLQ